MTFNIFKILKYQLYLLQLENYELGRYWKLLTVRGWLPGKQQRKDIVWTNKAKLIFVLAILIHVLILLHGFISYFYYFLFAVSLFLYPIFYTLLVIVLLPVDYVVKSILIFRAKSKIRNLKTKIIGVAGSYGKTTMKEMLIQVLGERFKVLGTPDSINTPVGIARWILNTLNLETEVLVVEMGEHYRGDIEEICKLTKPDISVVTGINEAHLERMGSLQSITDTIFEIVSSSKSESFVVLNGDDKNVVENYKKYIWPDHRVVEYKVESIKSKVFNTDNLNWKLEIPEIGNVEINLLGEYTLGNVGAIVAVAKELGMKAEEIKKGLGKIKPVEHRLEPIKSNSGILVIDDSYNGNPAGVREAIKVLGKFEGRRKLYITPGLVETGKATKEIHLEIGRQLAGVADVIILIKNSVTPWIAEGLSESVIANVSEVISNTEGLPRPSHALGARNDKPTIIWFNSAEEAHAGLKNILQPNDVILFQNDWGDSYL